MKKPSRFVPRVEQRPVSATGWTVLAVFGASVLFVIWQYPFASVAFIALVVGWSIVSNRNDRAHLQSLAATRSGESICHFAREVDCRVVDTWIVRAAYEEIQEHLSGLLPNFPVRGSDRLIEDLRIDPDDLDEVLAIDMAERSRRDLAEAEQNPYFGKVRTVRDLMMFLQAQPRLQR
jgi:hypothetical protein